MTEKKEVNKVRRNLLKGLLVATGVIAVGGVGGAYWLIETHEGHRFVREKVYHLLGPTCGEVFIQALKERMFGSDGPQAFPQNALRIALSREQQACISARGLAEAAIDLSSSELVENMFPGIDVFEARDTGGEIIFHQLRIAADRTDKLGYYSNLDVSNSEATFYQAEALRHNQIVFAGAATAFRMYLDGVNYSAAYLNPVIIDGEMQPVFDRVNNGQYIPENLEDNVVSLWIDSEGVARIEFVMNAELFQELNDYSTVVQSGFPLIINGEVIGRLPVSRSDVPFVPGSNGENIITYNMMQTLYSYFTNQVGEGTPVVYGMDRDGNIIITSVSPGIEISSVLHFLAAQGVENAFGGDFSPEATHILSSSGELLVYYDDQIIDPRDHTDGWNIIYVRR